MTARCTRARGQSLVELALVAPILILLAMSVWDGGSILREQVVLQQAARDGARVAATGYGTAVLDSVVANAVIASARDLPALSSTPGYVAISYPDAQSVQVRVTYAHSLMTPVLRQLWAGGSGTINLQASATFYLPRLTPVPATLVVPTATPSPTLTPTPAPTLVPTATVTVIPTATVTPTPPATATPTRSSTPSPSATPSPSLTSTPVPTATPSATATLPPTATPSPTATPTRTPTITPSATPSPTRTSTPSPSPTRTPTQTSTPTLTPTVTPTATPTPTSSCGPGAVVIPALTPNSGFWCTVQVLASSHIGAGWGDNNDPQNQLLIIAGQPGPTAGNLAIDLRVGGVLVAITNAPPAPTNCQSPGTYSVYFLNGGVDMPAPTNGYVTLFSCG